MAKFMRYAVWIYAAILIILIILAVLSLSGVFSHDFADPQV